MLKEQVKQTLLKQAEQTAKVIVELHFDDALALGKEKLKEAIPGQVDDMVIDLVVNALALPMKEALLAEIEKIHQEA